MFQLTVEEYESLRFQFGTSKEGKGGRRYQPLVFTENGVAMLSGILNSRQAVQVNIEDQVTPKLSPNRRKIGLKNK